MLLQRTAVICRESVSLIANSVFSKLVTGISAARNIPEGEVKSCIDIGPLTSNEALQYKVIDGVKYLVVDNLR